MTDNVDVQELEKFSQLAHKWWDKDSEFKPLHAINPARLAFVERLCGGLDGKRVLDVGCGGGILAESMAASGASVTGIDLAKKSLKVAQLHSLDSGVTVDYRCVSAEALAAEAPASFDVVTCMEMLEHVPSPHSIVQSCAALVKPGGLVVFSTLNRNLKSYLLAVVGAEYVLGLLGRGTHDYARFLKPSELSRMARDCRLQTLEVKGMQYNPLSGACTLSDDTDVNYLIACRRAG